MAIIPRQPVDVLDLGEVAYLRRGQAVDSGGCGTARPHGVARVPGRLGDGHASDRECVAQEEHEGSVRHALVLGDEPRRLDPGQHVARLEQRLGLYAQEVHSAHFGVLWPCDVQEVSAVLVVLTLRQEEAHVRGVDGAEVVVPAAVGEVVETQQGLEPDGHGGAERQLPLAVGAPLVPLIPEMLHDARDVLDLKALSFLGLDLEPALCSLEGCGGDARQVGRVVPAVEGAHKRKRLSGRADGAHVAARGCLALAPHPASAPPRTSKPDSRFTYDHGDAYLHTQRHYDLAYDEAKAAPVAKTVDHDLGHGYIDESLSVEQLQAMVGGACPHCCKRATITYVGSSVCGVGGGSLDFTCGRFLVIHQPIKNVFFERMLLVADGGMSIESF